MTLAPAGGRKLIFRIIILQRDAMTSTRPFFVFLGALVVVTFGFGLYVYSLESCAQQAAYFPVADCHKLYLAFGVLFAVAMMLSLGAAFYALLPAPTASDNPGKQIFDTLSKSLLPVVTLVLGYYFGSAQVSATKTERATSPDSAASGASAPIGQPSAPSGVKK